MKVLKMLAAGGSLQTAGQVTTQMKMRSWLYKCNVEELCRQLYSLLSLWPLPDEAVK